MISALASFRTHPLASFTMLEKELATLEMTVVQDENMMDGERNLLKKIKIESANYRKTYIKK